MPIKKATFRSLKTIKDLAGDPENPREIEKENLDGLKVSIKEFGDLSGICFNTKTGQLVSGHQRIDAIRAEFGVNVPIQWDDRRAWIEVAGGKQFPIRLVHWDMPTQRAANLAANNPHIAGHFTKSLQPQLDSIRAKTEKLFDGLRLAPLAQKPMQSQSVNFTVTEKFGIKIVCDSKSQEAKIAQQLTDIGLNFKILSK